MARNYSNPKAVALDNSTLESIIQTFLEDKSRENLAKLMAEIQKCRLLVPAQLPPNTDPKIRLRLMRGEKLGPKEMPRVLPLLAKNGEGKLFAPAYTSKKHLPDDSGMSFILQVPFDQIMNTAEAAKTAGIIVNPQTTNLVLHPQFIEGIRKGRELQAQANQKQAAGRAAMQAVEGKGQKAPAGGNAGTVQTKEVKMTPAQFEAFARKAVEMGGFPAEVRKNGEAFVKKLLEEREACVLAMYKAPYANKIPCKYQEEDFSMMALNISDDREIIAIDLPAAKVNGQFRSIYLVHNPQTEKVEFYAFMRSAEGSGTELVTVDEKGQIEALADPEERSELYVLIDYLDEE